MKDQKSGKELFILAALLFSAHLFFSTIFLLFSTPKLSLASEKPATDKKNLELISIIENGSVLLGTKGSFLVEINPEVELVPASIWKIATAAQALTILGPEYRFKTEIYQTEKGDIFIKGYGDPFLVSEEIDLFVEDLGRNLIGPPGDIFVDQSFFELSSHADGAGLSTNPYDAANFALAVNFNTLNLVKGQKGDVISAEPQTPDLPIMHLFSDKVKKSATRINISQNNDYVSRYAVELFTAKLNHQDKKHREGQTIFQLKTPKEAKLVYTHHSSKTLLEVVESMLLYSNNFIANQIFLVSGAAQKGHPATWEKGREALSSFLTDQVSLKEVSFKVSEGSGISRKNRVTALGMLDLLQYFEPYIKTMPQQNGDYLKSGTLSGVYSYAGYFIREDKNIPFVIILNQKKNNRDKILAYLSKMLF